MIHIQEPNSPWEVVHMDCVTELSSSGYRFYNSFLFIVDRYSQTPIFLPCHKDDTTMDTCLLLWDIVISHTGFFGTKLSFYTAYHPQTDGLEERMIQTLEDMIRKFWPYGLYLKDSDGFTHCWCTFIHELELAYKKYVHYSTGHTTSMLEKGRNPQLPEDKLMRNLIEINPTASSFNIIIDNMEK
ncbi:hypothetical protein O181_048326 [Austropuccinia psidii MF-1]|uniref:Integrase catalytic domain-containing protein n=1 Tax=Austropuccinia psidii MF-1 TaxID=1389203 RepID=A0A9Q3DXT8_9BASI|nr:hypothetical protein [Austropuccinia psidii MF-1]